MRRYPSAKSRAFLVIYLVLLVFAAEGCGADDDKMNSTGTTTTTTTNPPPPPPAEMLTVHYYRPLTDYDGTTLNLSGDTPAASPLSLAGIDAFGAYFDVPLSAAAKNVGVTVLHGQEHDPNAELAVDLQQLGNEIWVYSGSPHVYTAAPAIPAQGTAIIYYRRNDATYDGFALFAWGDITDTPTWDDSIKPTGVDQFGAYFTVHLKPDAQEVGFILHQGGTKDPGPDQVLKLATHGRRIWVGSGDPTLYTYPVQSPLINATSAHWVSADTIAWNLPGDEAALAANTYALYYDTLGGITDKAGRITGGQKIALSYDKAGLSSAIKEKFPHLASYKALRLDATGAASAGEVLKGQFVVAAEKGDGAVVMATGLQIPGVLDELYTYSGPLGVVWSGGAPTLNLWAPTARSVKLHLFDSPKDGTAQQVVDMMPTNGVFSASGPSTWKGKFYLYEVEVFVHATGKVEHNLVTDPYSLSLSANSQKSQIVDIADPTLAPLGWISSAKPPLAAPADISLYELHVRDFSINDAAVPAAHRGTFLAFTDTGSSGMKHLASLSAAGLTHVHLLPSFDFATVNEIKAEQASPGDLSGYAADGVEQQTAVAGVRDTDGFNWGYDPWHFTAPEGSYATDPDGSTRILEFRQMIKALNGIGLRVVMDVVYNHTTASGQDPKSVLDRIVPGYYHRLNDKGAVETSTCCQNTASEHAMMEKLMIDSLVTWAREYKVDGFRFDLMGHHMKSNIQKARAALDALTLANDGVDGPAIYLYGEGWDYGEVGNNARGVNATQHNMAGTGVGTFNDRLRDAVRGGGPFDGGPDLKRQGFASGLFYDPNTLDQGTPAQQKDRLLLLTDQIRVGLSGNLKSYSFVDRTSATVTGADVDYNGQPAGYTASPVEAITYVEAHDNQTLFDIFQYKAKDATDMATRVQMQDLAISIVALGQGVPFFHAGMEMLRSKSMDRDSYNSGDWFNKLDFTYASNNFGVGLPPAAANESNWTLMKPLLGDPTRKPAPADILASVNHFKAMLQIRKSTKLLRLGTADDVMARVRFHNTGAAQIPGLIVMSISDEVAGRPDLDPNAEAIVVLFNATSQKIDFTDSFFFASVLSLHPVQLSLPNAPVKAASFNAGTFGIPPRVAAVFVGAGNFP
jgi:pullulanase-type alpha-1,6-glucosidase